MTSKEELVDTFVRSSSWKVKVACHVVGKDNLSLCESMIDVLDPLGVTVDGGDHEA